MLRRPALVAAAFAALLALAAGPAQAAEKFIVFFHGWSGELDPAAQDVVDAAAAHAKANPAMRVEVMGFASTIGSRQANLFLSLLRAQLVSDRLEAAGVAATRISRVGEGAVNSVASPEEARRVEITVRAP